MFEQIEANSERWFELTPLKNEIWKDVNGFENLYQISNYGRLKSKGCNNTCKSSNKDIIRKSFPDGKKYLSCIIYKNKTKYNVRLHRLVAEAFIPNPENKPQVNHIDGNKENNCVDNLEWCTNSENQIHAFKFSLQKGAFKHHNSKLTLEQVLDIKNNCIIGSKKYGMQTFAKKYGVSAKSVQQIMVGKSYKYISNSDM